MIRRVALSVPPIGVARLRGCLGSARVRTRGICNVGLWLPSPGRVAPNATVLSENGGEFLFVDSACRYWAFKGDFDTAAGYWTDVKTGRLTNEELQEFSRNVLEQPWSFYAGESAPIPGQYRRAHWYLGDASNCSYEGCSQAALAHPDTARAWLGSTWQV